MKPNRLQYLLVTRAARIFNPQLAADAKVDYAKLFDGVNSANLKARKPTIVADAKKLLKGKTIAKDASVEHLAHMLDQFEHIEEPKSLDESVSPEQHRAMEAAAHGHSNIGIPKNVGEEFSEADKGKHFDAIPEFLREKGVDESVIKDCMDMLAKGRDELPENALDEEEEEEKAEDERDAEDEETEAEREEEERRKEKKGKDSKARDSRHAKDRKGAMDAKTVTVDEMNKAIDTAVKAANKNARDAVEVREFVRPYVGELPMALDSAEKILRNAATILGIEEAETVHPSALKTLIKTVGRKSADLGDGGPSLAHDHAGAADAYEFFPEARRIGIA